MEEGVDILDETVEVDLLSLLADESKAALFVEEMKKLDVSGADIM